MPHAEFTLFHMLLNAVEKAPDKVAIVDGDRSYTYRDMLDHSARFCAALREYGMKRGDRVGIYVEKSWEAIIGMLGVVQAGGVYVNINPLLKADQVTHIMNNCGVRMMMVDDVKLQLGGLPNFTTAFVRGALPEAPTCAERVIALGDLLSHFTPAPLQTVATESDLATIIYTSGSTGLPKGIMLSHHNVVSGAQIVSTYLENTSEDRLLSVLPLNFDVGMNQFTTMLRVGGTLVLQRSMMPGDILKSLRQHKITGLAGVPSVWTLLLQNQKSLEREPLTDLRYITNTGGQIAQPYVDKLRTLLINTKIFLMYGLTEAFRSTYLPPSEIHRGSHYIGRAIPNTDIWVVTEDGRECGIDEVGELIHRGPTVALGYWGDPVKTNAVYRVNPFAPAEMLGNDKVVYSGDLVKRDADGLLYYVGRRDEQIKTQGYRVSPQEIEELLVGTGVVLEAAAFGQKDAHLGQRIVAIVSFKAGSTINSAEELRRLVAERAPSHLIPQVMHVLNELPKNANGKIDRSLLRNEYARD